VVVVVVVVVRSRAGDARGSGFNLRGLTERTMVTRVGNVCTFSTNYADAGQVFLIGDFNDWSTTAHAMERCGGGGATWQASVRLPPGSYRFAYFVVHGRRALGDRPGAGFTALRADPRAVRVDVPHDN
jgi:1,4-alpha-glucan branching enzyme